LLVVNAQKPFHPRDLVGVRRFCHQVSERMKLRIGGGNYDLSP
jgi:hypothetical protein